MHPGIRASIRNGIGANPRLFVGRVLSSILAGIFIFSAIAKSHQPEPLEKMLAAIGVDSGRTLIVFLLSAFEMLLGAWLISSRNLVRPLLVFVVVLAIFAGGSQILLSLGIEDSCGCFGAVFEGTMESTRNRNVIILFACLASLFCIGAVRHQKGSANA